LEEAKIIEGKLNKLTGKLEKRCYYSFSELYIASIHLKVMRAYIDGVLRFGIPPKFLLTIVNAKSGHDRKILKSLTDLFSDPKVKGMYGTKEEIGDTEDFFPFVYIPISTL
jgi:V-type H+-transporting ATPase subunit C